MSISNNSTSALKPDLLIIRKKNYYLLGLLFGVCQILNYLLFNKIFINQLLFECNILFVSVLLIFNYWYKYKISTKSIMLHFTQEGIYIQSHSFVPYRELNKIIEQKVENHSRKWLFINYNTTQVIQLNALEMTKGFQEIKHCLQDLPQCKHIVFYSNQIKAS